MMSTERVLEYCHLKPERQPDEPKEISKNWPNDGKIEFNYVTVTYSEDGNPVLRDLSFSIKPKEKVGMRFCKFSFTQFFRLGIFTMRITAKGAIYPIFAGNKKCDKYD